MIGKRYLRTWFAIDVLGALPADLGIHSLSGGLSLSFSNFILFLLLLKLLRLFHVARFLESKEVSR